MQESIVLDPINNSLRHGKTKITKIFLILFITGIFSLEGSAQRTDKLPLNNKMADSVYIGEVETKVNLQRCFMPSPYTLT
jgi:hypothetical protein